MVVAVVDKATKKVSLDETSVVGLSEYDKIEAERSLELVNRLMADLVTQNGEIPPQPDQKPKPIDNVLSGLINNAAQAIKKSKPQEAIKLLSTALEAAHRRPLWEPVEQTMQETARLLSMRCDAYVNAEQWAEAYADISLSLILFPNDPMLYYRKATILTRVLKYDEAKLLLEQAQDMMPGNPAITQQLNEVNRVIATLNAAAVTGPPSATPEPAPKSATTEIKSTVEAKASSSAKKGTSDSNTSSSFDDTRDTDVGVTSETAAHETTPQKKKKSSASKKA